MLAMSFEYSEESVTAIKVVLGLFLAFAFLITNIFLTISTVNGVSDYSRVKEQPLYAWKESVELIGVVVGVERIGGFYRRGSSTTYLLFEDIKLGKILLQPNSMLGVSRLDASIIDSDEILVEAAFIGRRSSKYRYDAYGIKKLWDNGVLKADTSNPEQRAKQIDNQFGSIIILLVVGTFANLLLIFLAYVVRSMDVKYAN